MNEEIKSYISELLNIHCSKDKDGCFYVEIYTDYRDKLSSKNIQKITESDCPSDEFYEILNESYQDSQYSIQDIYGVTSALWTDNAINEIHPMKKSA